MLLAWIKAVLAGIGVFAVYAVLWIGWFVVIKGLLAPTTSAYGLGYFRGSAPTLITTGLTFLLAGLLLLRLR